MTNIPGKYFAADLSTNDLLKTVSSHPYIFWTGLAIIVVVLAGYGIYHISRKKAG